MHAGNSINVADRLNCHEAGTTFSFLHELYELHYNLVLRNSERTFDPIDGSKCKRVLILITYSIDYLLNFAYASSACEVTSSFIIKHKMVEEILDC